MTTTEDRYTSKDAPREYAVWTVQHSSGTVKWFKTEDEAREVARKLSTRRNGRYDYSVTRYPNDGSKYQRLAVFSNGQEVVALPHPLS